MSRIAVAAGCRGPRWATLAGWALLTLLAALALVAQRPASQAAPPARVAGPERVAIPQVDAPLSANGATPTPPPHAAPALAAAPPPGPRATGAPAEVPYRVVGRSTASAETSIVLFGRGRIVTLSGPGRLDDDYEVEALFDDYLVLRHLPSGAGTFLELTPRGRGPREPRDPEEWPRD